MLVMRVSICGIGIDNTTMALAVDRIGKLVELRKPSIVVTPNVDHIVRLQRDKEFRRAYKAADLVLPDGAPLLWADPTYSRRYAAWQRRRESSFSSLEDARVLLRKQRKE
jgi:UDP-N-acetyl-D-mannosaminuronic acid transferase (WecB/TagA/CpsF family)